MINDDRQPAGGTEERVERSEYVERTPAAPTPAAEEGDFEESDTDSDDE